MNHARSDRYWDKLSRVVRAAEGCEASLAEVANDAELTALSMRSQLGASLALGALRQGLRGPVVERWQKRLHGSASLWLLIDAAAETVFSALADSGGRWAPIKGFDVGTRFYDPREARPISDLDILVERRYFEAACAALGEAGWLLRERGRRARQFLVEEGYTCHFSGRAREDLPDVLVELHFRLWGLVPEGLESEILMEARGSEAAQSGPFRLSPAHAYLLAATHGWTRTKPYDLVDYRDLQAVLSGAGAERAAVADAIVERARRWSLQLPVCLSACVAARLWPGGGHETVADRLEERLTWVEKREVERLRQGGLDAVSLPRLVMARLLSGRPSRAGWRSVWRRAWAHPGVVELETPDQWSWPRRRFAHVSRSLRRGPTE